MSGDEVRRFVTIRSAPSILWSHLVSHSLTAHKDAKLHQAHSSCGWWQQKPCDSNSIQSVRRTTAINLYMFCPH